MANILLWNVNKQPLDGLILNLVQQRNVDVVFLVEYALGVSKLDALLPSVGLFKQNSPDRFGVFIRNGYALTPSPVVNLGRRAGLWTLIPPNGLNGTVALLHALDRRNYDDATRRMFFRRVGEAVRRHEVHCGHRRSIILGDFNAQPFDPAVIAADGLHALGVHSIRTKTSRIVSGFQSASDFFYNPM